LRIGPESGPWLLHDTAAAKALEAHALARAAPHELMERAGLAVARLARAVAPSARHVEVWCGPGNNGGDGFVAARLLHEAATAVTVLDCAPDAERPADAGRALARAVAAGVRIVTPGTRPAAEPGLVVDALLGLGASRAPHGGLAEAVAAIHARRAPVVAVDLPTGLSADTGQPLGTLAVRAAHTLALLSLKPGLFTGQGRDFAGCVWFDDLGTWAADEEAVTAASTATARLLGPARRAPAPHSSHKGTRGDLWVVGGAQGMAGAAALAASAGLAAGAGRVYVSTLACEGPAGFGRMPDDSRPELMHRSLASARAQQLEAQATIVAGCGGGEAIRPHLPMLLGHAVRLVLDADALNAIAQEPALLRLLAGRRRRGQHTVLTPHPLEAGRLLRLPSQEVQADRLANAQALADQAQCTVVLKGSGTVIASPATLPALNPSGNAALATAGTGDVLAGWLGGLWAQAPLAPAHEVACQAAWQHGHAADAARPSAGAAAGAPLLAADLISALSSTA
jgi:hydroxyethylthiazole kinase-like uncharacterized protein yjeF